VISWFQKSVSNSTCTATSGGRLESCATTPRHRESLLNVVEGYVMGGVQGKVLDGISRTFSGDDAKFDRALERIAGLPPKALGMHPSHLKAVDAFAVGSLRGLGQLSCPRHMATAVCDVMRHLAGNCARLRTWSEEDKAERERRKQENKAAKQAAASGYAGGGETSSENVVAGGGEGAGGGAEGGAGAGAASPAGAEHAADDDEHAAEDDDEDDEDDEDEPASIPSTDDLLSLLVVLVAKARPARAVSLAAYMDAFHALVGTGRVACSFE
jgi:hypothetical protein